MSSFNGHGSPPARTGPAEPTAGAESDPSMEDILASIRRILSEDGTLADAPAEQQSKVFNLDESMLVSAPKHEAARPSSPPTPQFGMHAAHELSARTHEVVRPTVSAVSATPAEASMKTGDGNGRGTDHINAAVADGAGAQPLGPLVAQAATDAASASMGALMRTLAAERQVSLYRGGPTLEDMVRDEMRPILKDWLDTNLPALVERVVRVEIERVSQRAAG